MKEKMTWGGVGPAIALISLPYILLALWVHRSTPDMFSMKFLSNEVIHIIGWALLLVGTVFYVSTIYVFLTNFKKGVLITHGTYGLCRNPIYASMIVFIIPSLGFLFHSWLILSIAAVIYVNFKMAIHGEYNVLKQNFGENYDLYEKSVNELIPFPRFWSKS